MRKSRTGNASRKGVFRPIRAPLEFWERALAYDTGIDLKKHMLSAVIVFGWLTLTASAATASAVPMPRPDTPRLSSGTPPAAAVSATRVAATTTGTVSQLSAADLSAARDAFAEADRSNWIAATRHVTRISDPVAAKLVLWTRLLAEGSGATFAEIVSFREQNPEWPRLGVLALRAENALLAYPMSNSDVLGWFSANPPVTGEGKIRFGKALVDTGKANEGISWIRRGWVEHDFSATRQKEILASYGSHFDAETQKARLSRLLWENRTEDARNAAAVVGQDARALTDARIQLSAGSSQASAALSRVPSILRTDPGLLYDQVRYERRRGNDHTALPLLLTAPTEPHKMIRPDIWWVERKILARKALSGGLYQQAYELSAAHGLTEGVEFAEGEFMAGWIALQFLNKSDVALAHFKRLGEGVSTPISKARAFYWSGRAASAAGNMEAATGYYRQAASYPVSFYGQLATAALAGKGGDGKLNLPANPVRTAESKQRFDNRELVRAARILQDLDRERTRWTVMLHLADTLTDPAELAALSDLARSFGDQKLSLRIAKAAASRNIILPDHAYPTTLMPQWTHKGPPVEKALVYGLSRQESEFDPKALSPAGARGLMQLMPGTARIVARQIGVPYSADRLTDPIYNATLGAAHLGDLIENDFGGSYIMSIAAYNAGGGRVRQWVNQFGDPRSSAVDPIDWIETIPFSETRNYVQRVIENLEVYRGRLTDEAQPARIADDLRRHTGTPMNAPAPTPRPSNVPLPPPAATLSTSPSLVPSPIAPPLGSAAMAPVIEDGESSAVR